MTRRLINLLEAAVLVLLAVLVVSVTAQAGVLEDWEAELGAECDEFSHHSGFVPGSYDVAVFIEGGHFEVHWTAGEDIQIDPPGEENFGWDTVLKCHYIVTTTTTVSSTTTEPSTPTTLGTTTTTEGTTTVPSVTTTLSTVPATTTTVRERRTTTTVETSSTILTTTTPPTTTSTTPSTSEPPKELPFTGSPGIQLGAVALLFLLVGTTLAMTSKDRNRE